MLTSKNINIVVNRKRLTINTGMILYAVMVGRCVEIHMSSGEVYTTRMPLAELAEELGDRFIQVHRGCIVSAMAIHDITDYVNLSNGESLIYTLRKKQELLRQLGEKQKDIVNSFFDGEIPATEEEYRKYYFSFEYMPFAFTDIEMIFNEERHAVDWIFRYGNPALARVEKIPLEKLIGHSFGSIFKNMDSKWLRSYERATLYGEQLEMIDYSPEIDAYLKVICFPTFKGHCGCILFNLSDICFTQTSDDAQRAMRLYFGGEYEENR